MDMEHELARSWPPEATSISRQSNPSNTPDFGTTTDCIGYPDRVSISCSNHYTFVIWIPCMVLVDS